MTRMGGNFVGGGGRTLPHPEGERVALRKVFPIRVIREIRGLTTAPLRFKRGGKDRDDG